MIFNNNRYGFRQSRRSCEFRDRVASRFFMCTNQQSALKIGVNWHKLWSFQWTPVIATVEDAWKTAFLLGIANSNRVFFEQCVYVPLTHLNQQYRSNAFVCPYTLPDYPSNFENAQRTLEKGIRILSILEFQNSNFFLWLPWRPISTVVSYNPLPHPSPQKEVFGLIWQTLYASGRWV